jgi:predicted PurR-regulated permease PerM
MQRKQATTLFLLVLAGATLYLCYVIARPFLEPFFVAVMIAIVVYPVHARIQARVRRQNAAALISTILVLVILIVPTIGLGVTVHKEITRLYQSLSESSAGQGGWNPYVTHATEHVVKWVGKYIDLSSFDLRGALTQWLKNISQPLLSVGAHAVTNVFVFIANAVVTFFTLFYLFREGRSMREHLGAILPLKSSQVERLFTGIDNSIIANVHGCIAVGVSQAVLTGLAFWVLGLPSPVLWAMVTGLFSMVPVIGSAAVWGPAAILLVVSGHWLKGLLLLGWGAAVVAQVDSVVRPFVISHRANMHPLLIFFALLGGVKAFGPIGLFVGPVVVSVTIVVFDLLRETNRDVSESSSPP